ncbi:Protoporphyrinogen oxidase, chloroplastic [Galdieria sulphuraria]|nr:Protoporphyrinogen oxidase, chloroplastic [Galdieria sulphuraria]
MSSGFLCFCPNAVIKAAQNSWFYGNELYIKRRKVVEQQRTTSHVSKLPFRQTWKAVSAQHTEDGECSVLIIGSGVTGSTAAFQLAESGIDVLVAEKNEQVGGNIISRKEQGFIWEEGPNTFQPTPDILVMIEKLGLVDKLVLADAKLPRYVFYQDKLHKIPSSPFEACQFSLLSTRGKLRAFLGAIGFAPMNLKKKEETVRDFVTRHLGEEVYERLVDPFISGVYAGDPSKLSMKAAFKRVQALEEKGVTQSLIEGAIIRMFETKNSKGKKETKGSLKVPRGSLGSFKDGLQMYPQSVQSKLSNKVKTGWKLIRLEKSGNGSSHQSCEDYFAVFQIPNGITKVIRTKALIFTSPAYITASLLRPFIPNASDLLEQIYYPCVVSVSLAYPSSSFRFPLSGFGHLIPRSTKIRTLGTIWSSSLFPYRVPEGYHLLSSYIGGAQDTDIASLSEDQVVKQVDSDIRKILLRQDAALPKVLGVRHWNKAIPQYELGHLSRMETIQSQVSETLPGVFLGGNYVSGISFGDCVSFGMQLADQASYYIKENTELLSSTVV